MTVGEIKERYSMADIAARYGLQPDRKGFIQCPFHSGDRQASLKLYEKDFNCFACSANGDIFTFVQRMEDLSFKEAFQALGGTYEKPTFSSKLIQYRSEQMRRMKQKEAAKLEEKKELNNLLITVFRKYMDMSEPLSDVWCDCYNALQYQLYIHSQLTGIPF